MAKWLMVLAGAACLLVGCAGSHRQIDSRVALYDDHGTTITAVSGHVDDQGVTPYSVGDPLITSRAVRLADGTTSASQTVAIPQQSATTRWAILVTGAAAIITAVGAAF